MYLSSGADPGFCSGGAGHRVRTPCTPPPGSAPEAAGKKAKNNKVDFFFFLFLKALNMVDSRQMSPNLIGKLSIYFDVLFLVVGSIIKSD
jgi:hypothetical protein